MDAARSLATANATSDMGASDEMAARVGAPTDKATFEAAAAKFVMVAIDKYIAVAYGSSARGGGVGSLEKAADVLGAVVDHYVAVRCAARGGKFQPSSADRSVLEGMLGGALRGLVAAAGDPYGAGWKHREQSKASAMAAFQPVLAAYADAGMRSTA